MKFRVERKDLIIFICFCIFLFYMCCIGVLNLSSLASEGEFYGIIPFKALTGEYIGATLVLFFPNVCYYWSNTQILNTFIN